MRPGLALALVWLVACVYDPQFQEGKTRCAPSGACPGGFRCALDAGVCVLAGQGDASVDEAMPAQPADGSADGPQPDGSPADAAVTDGAPHDVLAAEVVPPDASLDVSCESPPAACQGMTGAACQDDAVVMCARDARGCLVIVSMGARCGPTRRCEGRPAACVCPPEPPQCHGADSSFCPTPDQLRLCESGPDGCVQLGTAMSCPLGKTCLVPTGTFAAACVATP
jgi:hypothetical protein